MPETLGTTGVGTGVTMGTAKAAAGAVGDFLGGPPGQENLFSPATELIREGAKVASDTVQGTAAVARDTVGGMFQRKQGGGSIERGAQAVKDTSRAVKDAAQGTAAAATDTVENMFSGQQEGGVVQSGTQAAEATARAAADTALGTARVAKDTIKGPAATGTIGGVYKGLKSGAQAAQDTVGAATNTVKSAVYATGAAMDTVSGKLLGSEQQGGMLGAIGETIVEIAQTTKDIVVGPADIQQGADIGYADVTDSSQTEVTKQRLQKNW